MWRDWKRWREAIFPALYAAAVLLTWWQYGVTWDESVQRTYGELALRYFTGHGGLQAINNFYDLRYYGPLFEMIAAAFTRLAPSHPYEVRHLLIALTGIATVIGAGRFARHLGVSAELAQLLLVLNPQFYGMSFNNSKDVPLACAVVWTMVALARIGARASGPLARRRPAGAVGSDHDDEAGRLAASGRDGRAPLDIVLLSLAIGAMLSLRVGAVLIVFIAVVAFVLARQWRALAVLAVATAAGWLLMIATWPSAHQHPLSHPLEALQIARLFPFAPPVLFEGRLLPNDALPRRYLLEMFAVTMPIATVLLAVAGAVREIKRRSVAGILALCWLVIPFAAFAVAKPAIYDGIRHFLFVVPVLAILAASALDALPRFRAAVVAIAVAAPLIAMVRLHPYQYTYYNAFAGGTHGAARLFETDYWASSYRGAALWLNAHRCPGRPTRVLVAATAYSAECLTYYLPRGAFSIARLQTPGKTGPLPAAFDYYVATTRYGWAANFRATPIVSVVGRDKAVFTVIRGSCR